MRCASGTCRTCRTPGVVTACCGQSGPHLRRDSPTSAPGLGSAVPSDGQRQPPPCGVAPRRVGAGRGGCAGRGEHELGVTEGHTDARRPRNLAELRRRAIVIVCVRGPRLPRCSHAEALPIRHARGSQPSCECAAVQRCNQRSGDGRTDGRVRASPPAGATTGGERRRNGPALGSKHSVARPLGMEGTLRGAISGRVL